MTLKYFSDRRFVGWPLEFWELKVLLHYSLNNYTKGKSPPIAPPLVASYLASSKKLTKPFASSMCVSFAYVIHFCVWSLVTSCSRSAAASSSSWPDAVLYADFLYPCFPLSSLSLSPGELPCIITKFISTVVAPVHPWEDGFRHA